jgi:hypothetical protein
VSIGPDDVEDVGRYVDLGVDHIVVGTGHPFDLGPVERLIAQRDAMA